jgi:hypothetical protein
MPQNLCHGIQKRCVSWEKEQIRVAFLSGGGEEFKVENLEG